MELVLLCRVACPIFHKYSVRDRFPCYSARKPSQGVLVMKIALLH
jgi:hypothetical protein